MVKGKFLNLDTDTTLSSNSDYTIPSQKAIKSYVDNSIPTNYVPNTRKINNKALSSDITLTASDVSAVAANTAITGATKCKITYDSKGLVTSGADLIASDIPDISATYQTKITSSNKVAASNVSGLATVATSGDYDDLTDKPTVTFKKW